MQELSGKQKEMYELQKFIHLFLYLVNITLAAGKTSVLSYQQ